jgi:dTMP kinase
MNNKGCFITLEGIEGVGKTTNLEHIESYLVNKGISLRVTREPGGTALGEAIRELLLGHKHEGMSAASELLLMFAARAEHIDKVIRPALEQGDWVLCDRFTDATYAYQGGGRGVAEDEIGILEEWVQHGLQPDLTILLDLPVETGIARAGKRSAPDRFENEAAGFFEKVRAAYLHRARLDAQRFRIIDASRPLPDVQQDISRILDELIVMAE